MKPLAILGSARPDGGTRKAVNIAFAPETIHLAILPHVIISGYDYGYRNAGGEAALERFGAKVVAG
jgi:hypothetical protein